MPSSNTDKLRKGVAQWSGVIGSGGVNDGTVTTIPLSSVSGIPTDTAVMITINRVDTLGVITGNFEGVVGTISGNNVIDCLRGVEGTAQAWLAGTVVEILFTADNWNDLIDAFLVAFNQDGTIKTSTVLTTPVINTSFTGTAKAASGDITTGTADNLIVTPKGLKDAGIIPNPSINRAFTWYLDGTSVDGVAGATYIAPQNMTVTQVQTKLTSGTCTITLKKGATTIDAENVTNTLATDTTITSAAITKGDLITLTLSSSSAPVGLSVTMEVSQP